MIVDALNVLGAVRRPDEAKPELLVDADRMLPFAIRRQRLQTVAWSARKSSRDVASSSMLSLRRRGARMLLNFRLEPVSKNVCVSPHLKEAIGIQQQSSKHLYA